MKKIKNIFLNDSDPNSEGELIHFDLEPSSIQLLEGPDKKFKRAKIQFLVAGWNSNDYYFSDSSLDEVLSLMKGTDKIFLDHDFWGMGRSNKDWAASFDKTWKDGEILFGEIRFTSNPNTVWLYQEMKSDIKSVQFSIDIRAIVKEKETPEGRTGREIEKVIAYRSTDIVTYAAAGGEGIKILNQEFLDKINNIHSFITNKKESQDMELKDVKGLESTYPNLVAEIRNEAISDKSKLEASETLKTENTQLKNDLSTKTSENETLVSDDKTQKVEMVSLKEQITTLEQEKTDLAAKVDTFETKEKKESWEGEVQAAIKESKLDSKYVTEVFMNQLLSKDKIEDVKQLLEDRLEILSGIAPVIKNGSVNKPTESSSKEVSDEVLIAGITA